MKSTNFSISLVYQKFKDIDLQSELSDATQASQQFENNVLSGQTKRDRGDHESFL
jgi:hypothetical protein